jgi:hypothetical protein
MVLPQFQELSDFTQGETQPLHLPDKAQPGHIIIGVKPEASHRARRFGKQGTALIEANGIHCDYCQLCYFSDLQVTCGVT